MGKYSRKRIETSKQFTNAETIKDNFFANSERRRKAGDKASGDAGYWTEGRCNWGGSHNLMEDCEALARFFNDTNSIADNTNEIKLSANEEIFNQKKQALISKVQNLISKCQTTSTSSIASVCCIWNDYFGSFLKSYLDTFSKTLQRQLKEVQNLEPKHQTELLQLEAEAKRTENDYKENKAKADQETDPDKKAALMLLVNKAAKKAEEIKRKIKANPLADLSRFSNLDDLTVLLKGNVPKKPPSSNRSSSSNSSQNTSNSNPSTNPENNSQLLIFAGLAILIIFYLYTQNQEHYDY
jgi:hypothetical protein